MVKEMTAKDEAKMSKSQLRRHEKTESVKEAKAEAKAEIKKKVAKKK